MATPIQHAIRCLAIGLFALPGTSSSAPVFVTEVRDPSVSSHADDKTSIALNSQDLPGIAYVGSSFPGQIKYLRQIGSAWAGSSTAPSEPHKFHFPSLAFDAQDKAHIAYEHETSAVNTGNLRYAIYDGISWSDQLLLNDENNLVGGGNSIAVDADGESHLAFQYEGNGIRYGQRSVGGAWTYRTVDPSNPTKVIALALDPAGGPAVVFEGGSAVKFARENAGSWSSTSVTGSANAGQYLSLAFDPVGNAHICYHDAIANALKYAVSGAGGAWSVSTVETGGGMHCDIAVDGAGVPHISYRSNSPVVGALKYATKPGAAWEITVVDAVVSERTSIAVTDDGIPHISYVAGNALKYARQSIPVAAVDVEDPGSGQFEWQVHADDAVTGVSGFFRRGGEAIYRSMNSFTKQGNTWVSPVPTAEVTLRGFDYYLTTEGVVSQFGSRQNPKRLAVSVSEAPGPTLTPLAWRMIAAPLQVSGNANTPGLLAPFFGPVGDTGWRMGCWNAATARYQTIGVETNLGLESGRAYWLGVTRAAAWSLSGQSALPDRDSCFTVLLVPGWNMVGNPAAYRISLDPTVLQVDDGTTRDTFASQAANGVVSADIFTYEPTLIPPYRTTSTGLDAWEGCWIRNTTTPPRSVSLLIPGLEVAAAIPSERPGREAPEHLIQVNAFSAEERACVEIGIQSGAADGKDPWDIDLPPGVPGQSLFLGLIPGDANHGGFFHFRDVRPLFSARTSWRLVVSNPKSPVTLEWFTPSDEAVGSFVLSDGARVWDMRTVRSVTLGQGRHDLVLIAAPVEGPIVGPAEWPLRLSPSPLLGDGVIQYGLPVAADAHLAVYDVRGRRIWSTSFENRSAGQHAVVWDGLSDLGRPIAAGVYFLVLDARQRGVGSDAPMHAVRRFTVLRPGS